ncbi:GDSL-type esterase/lipase family protein [Coraliomargarita sp. SDUM461004]|uniref:GDSL-type esterase/lipase family protein n=1 Tax=Thalassobacterium sedimentorum TaxID=3041258 RepID=A0ABU1AJ12_9BACT|nr:GDSL-type esterase/lipase family protein [Coraliomargarita sp. SDUM461004]MDQ8194810.1 GDSL-type esterase/lipase family protein [Coraliomargarita sp. SDUM461004]
MSSSLSSHSESMLYNTPQHKLSFKQTWLEKESEDFRPATVELTPNTAGLDIVVNLEDEDIYSDATELNQKTWELGDVLEIFVGTPGQSAYWELHITPNNQRLQLAWDEHSFKAYRKGTQTFEDFLISDPEFIHSEVTVDTENNRWQARVFLPWESINLPRNQHQYTLELAFCRYDADHSKEKATLSSTAPLSKASYHRRHEWDTIQLKVPQQQAKVNTNTQEGFTKEPIVVVLVGDSTVTGKSKGKDQAGWGWALQHWTSDPVKVINTAVGGRSSRSFRSEGRWDAAMALNPDWVFIQFGHNDQKGKGPERESAPETDYRDHLRRYIKEAREQGAKPILITPVCRRSYQSNGQLKDSLEAYAEAVQIVAEEMEVPCLDLHQYSFDEFSKLTAEEALSFSPSGTTDRTHFSTSGSATVAQWVLNLMEVEVPELASQFSRPSGEAKP